MKKNIVNILSLACIQGSNALLPVIVFPFLLAKLGAEKYSSIVVAESISLFILTFVLYSYEINGLTMTIRNRHRGSESISVIFSEIFYARMLIWLISLLVASIGFYIFDGDLFVLVCCWSLVALGYIFQSSYLFQAFEHNLPVAVFTMVSRLSCVGIIFLMADSSWPKYLAPLTIGLSYFVTGFLSFLYSLTVFKIRLKRISLAGITSSLKGGQGIFLGNLSVLFYKDSSVLLLNTMGISPSALASYSVAEKLVKALQAAIRPLNQYYYTRVVYQLDSRWVPNRQTLHLILKKTWIQVFLVLSLSAILYWSWYFLQDPILTYLGKMEGRERIDRIARLSILMAPAAIFGIVNFMLGSTGLNNLNAVGYYAKSLVLTGLLSLVVGTTLVYYFGEYGASISFVVGEFFLLLLVLRKFLCSKQPMLKTKKGTHHE